MKRLTKLSINIISVIVIGLIGLTADIILGYSRLHFAIDSGIGLVYTAAVCFLLTVIISEDASVFSFREKIHLSRVWIIRLIIAFVISVVMNSSFVLRIFLGGRDDIVSISVVSGIIFALRWIAVYVVMTVKNVCRKGTRGILAVSVSALVFSVIAQYISGIRLYDSLQSASDSLLGYLSAISSVDILSLVIANAADIIIMCVMVLAAHFSKVKINADKEI